MPTEKFQEGEYRITHGPSKFDLMLALFCDNPPKSVEFTMTVDFYKKESSHYALIDSVERENGTFENWIINMRITKLNKDGSLEEGTTSKAVARYSTKIRHGILRKLK